LVIDDARYAFQPRVVLADVRVRAVPRRHAGASPQLSYGVQSGRMMKWPSFTGDGVDTVKIREWGREPVRPCGAGAEGYTGAL
jgi:hypothetical protein